MMNTSSMMTGGMYGLGMAEYYVRNQRQDEFKILGNNRIFINDGTPGGTGEVKSVTVGNSRYIINKIYSPSSDSAVIKVLNRATGEVSSTVIKGSTVAERALTQIGNTAGYDLVSRMNSTRNYPVTVYNPQVAALSTVNYFNTLSYETYAASRMYGNQGNNNFPNIEYINEPVYNRNIAREAASWQGKGVCSGVGKWREIELKNGTKVIGGLPGQSEFYTTQRGFFRTNGIKTELWEGLQVKASPQFGYRPQVGVYKVISNSEAAFSITKLIHNMGQEVYHKYIFLIIRQI